MAPVYSFALKIDGVDVADYGLAVSELRGNWDGPQKSFDEVEIPGHEGPVATILTPTVAALDFVVVGIIQSSSPSQYESDLDALKFILYRAPVTLIAGNITTRQRTGIVLGTPVTMPFPSMAGGRIEIRVRCRDPFAYAATPTTVTGSANTDVEMPLGTHTSLPVITLTTATNPVVTLKNSAGATIGGFTLAGTGTFVIDCANQTVSLGGTRDDSLMTAGDYFALDPHDGVPATTDWPTIRTSSGSLSVTYTERYL
jgi:phage-related protein